MLKVYYDTQTYEISAILEQDVAPEQYVNLGFVYCDGYDSLEEIVDIIIQDNGPNNPVTEEKIRRGFKFPSDINKLKVIAAYTIDIWRNKQQAGGYTHTDGKEYGTSEQIRSLLIGKIQELDILGIDYGLFPDIAGVPVTHNIIELKAIGTGVAGKIEADYLAAVSLTQQLYHPSIDTLQKIEALLGPVMGDL